MKFLFKEEITPEIRYAGAYLKTINIMGKKAQDYVCALGQEHKEEVLHNLNMINNQGITDIVFGLGIYYIGDLKLYFKDLCTAEKVFLVATAAHILKKPVYLCNDIYQLSKQTLRTYLKLFYESEYVNIVYKEADDDLYFKMMIKEVGYDYISDRK